MTTRQIAELTGRSERSVRRWAEDAGAKMSAVADKMSADSYKTNGTDWNLDETLAILRAGKMPEAFISLLVENAKQKDALVAKESAASMIHSELQAIAFKLDQLQAAKPKALPAPKAPKPRRAPMRDFYDGEARINRACRLSGDGKIDLSEVLGVDERVIARAAEDRKIRKAARYSLEDAQDINYGIWRTK